MKTIAVFVIVVWCLLCAFAIGAKWAMDQEHEATLELLEYCTCSFDSLY